MSKLKKDTYSELINRITGGQPTQSLQDVVSYEDMQEFNKGAASDRVEARRKSASSYRKAAQIILNA